jgi:hypothetical protein
MKGLRDLSPLLEAPALETLHVYDAGHMQPSDFEVLKGHPSLAAVSLGLGSARKNDEVKKILPFPESNLTKREFEFRA